MSLLSRLRPSGRPLRVAYGRIFHEANAYSPLTTEREDFERFHLLEGAELEEEGEYRRALSALRKLVRRHPDSLWAQKAESLIAVCEEAQKRRRS